MHAFNYLLLASYLALTLQSIYTFATRQEALDNINLVDTQDSIQEKSQNTITNSSVDTPTQNSSGDENDKLGLQTQDFGEDSSEFINNSMNPESQDETDSKITQKKLIKDLFKDIGDADLDALVKDVGNIFNSIKVDYITDTISDEDRISEFLREKQNNRIILEPEDWETEVDPNFIEETHDVETEDTTDDTVEEDDIENDQYDEPDSRPLQVDKWTLETLAPKESKPIAKTSFGYKVKSAINSVTTSVKSIATSKYSPFVWGTICLGAMAVL